MSRARVRHHDKVPRRQVGLQPKRLARQSLEPVAIDRTLRGTA